MRTTTQAIIATMLIVVLAASGTKGQDKTQEEFRPDPQEWLSGIWHFKDYGLLLNPAADHREILEVRPVLGGAGDSQSKDIQDAINNFKIKIPENLQLIEAAKVNDFIDLKPGKNAVLLRLRDNFQYYNEDAQGAKLSWSRDYTTDADDFLDIHAAAMLDFYLDPLYNSNLLFKDHPSRFFLRLGAEIDRSTGGDLEEEQNIQRYYLLGTFWANDPKDFAGAPNPIQFGAIFERDEIASQDRFKVLLNWEPAVVFFNGIEGWWSNFAIGRRVKYERYRGLLNILNNDNVTRSSAAGAAEPALDADSLRGPYFYFRPKLGIESALGGSDGLLKDLGIGDYMLTAQLKTGLAVFEERLKIDYTAVGMHDLDGSGDEQHFFHRVRAEIAPMKHADFGLYVEYTNGEQSPTFRKEDRISAGAVIRF